jgi:hypothetical protein
MSLKNDLKKTIDNVSDAVSEAGHRTSAEAERVSREAAGDELTPGEKLGSAMNEGKERVLADIDKAKRDVRNNV